MALTKVSYSMIEGAAANILDFGADPTGVADSTTAIQAAQQASKFVYCPPGDYSVAGLRIYDQVNLIGAGYENTRFLQRDPAQPAINCLSDATVGQLLSLRLENFGVVGHASATVTAVNVQANTPYAIYRSHFDMIISECYQALLVQTDANSVFYCTFSVDVVDTQTTSVILNGGTYNTYDFFIAQCGNGRMMDHAGVNNTFIRLVGEGQVLCSGQNIIYLSPTIEELPNTPPSAYGFVLSGFNQTLITPTIILSAASSTKITYCIKPFEDSLIINPRFLVNGTLNPFDENTQSWTLQGPGQNNCVNKMEVIYDGSNANKDLRKVARIGDVNSFITACSGTYAGKSVQYQAYAAGVSVNHTILNSTDSMIYSLAGTATLINVSLSYGSAPRQNGQTLTVYASAAITTLTWNGNGSDATLFPLSMTAGQVLRFVYDAGTNKWWPN
jgi:hypothetical protein